jgi:predicted pyridoxine 5'-phosphate oxidase superfamily flavin-nucleotide-binding protein
MRAKTGGGLASRRPFKLRGLTMSLYPPSSDVAFSASVKAEQQRRGSRAQYRKLEERGGWPDKVTSDLEAFIGGVRSFYLGTASADGQPYIQHRGGPAGFVRVLDATTLAFADYRGNRQYITLGNLAENPRAFIFLMDYARRLRIKLWGKARVVEGDDVLLRRVAQPGEAPPERCIVFDIETWDRNCPQHIPLLLPAEDVERALGALQERIAKLEAENAELRRVRA